MELKELWYLFHWQHTTISNFPMKMDLVSACTFLASGKLIKASSICLCVLYVCPQDIVKWPKGKKGFDFVLFLPVVTEKSRTNWHLINVRQPSTQQYVMKYVKKGSRVFVGGRIEYLRSQDEQGQTKDLAVVISGACLIIKLSLLLTGLNQEMLH